VKRAGARGRVLPLAQLTRHWCVSARAPNFARLVPRGGTIGTKFRRLELSPANLRRPQVPRQGSAALATAVAQPSGNGCTGTPWSVSRTPSS
jgi:hypothetical protein